MRENRKRERERERERRSRKPHAMNKLSHTTNAAIGEQPTKHTNDTHRTCDSLLRQTSVNDPTKNCKPQHRQRQSTHTNREPPKTNRTKKCMAKHRHCSCSPRENSSPPSRLGTPANLAHSSTTPATDSKRQTQRNTRALANHAIPFSEQSFVVTASLVSPPHPPPLHN